MVFLCLIHVFGCGKTDDGPPPTPEASVLIFPEASSECTTGISISADLSQVTFQWQEAKNTDFYTLTAVNLFTNTPQTLTTESTTAALTLEKGAPYSWSIVSGNSNVEVTASSETWLFYNAGSQTTYPPFPAQIEYPKSGSPVLADENGQIVLKWLGADVENDITSYELYFSDNNPPETLLTGLPAATSEIAVDVSPDQIYFWRIVTTDASGNTSDSGIFDFRVL